MTASKVLLNDQPCPHCNSSDAYHVYDDGHGYCFSCEYYHPPETSASFTRDNFSYQFLPWRGVEATTFQTFASPTKIDKEGKPLSIGFRYPNGDYKVRSLDKKDFHWIKNGKDKPGLFGRDKFAAGSHKYVTVTEGELDALSLYQVLKSPVVSVHSATSAVSDCTMDRSFLNSYERIYLAFDADASGREATAGVARLFDYNKVYDVRFTNRKDANEYVAAGEGDELRNIWWNAKRYLPETIVSSLDEFKKIVEEKPKYGIPYPFPTLTEMTYGIRTGESVLLTAQEGVGKTELMHAIEYSLLKERDYNVGAIFLEEPKKRHLEALAGINLRCPAHLPDSGCTPDQVIRALEEVVRSDDRLHIYSHFGSSDPDVLLDTIRFLVSARGCRIILLDHISMVVSGLSGEDERRALDYISTRLEMMVKELDFALIMVSHVNDDGKTRGSRYISKIADIRIDAVRDVAQGSDYTELSISKNRYCGKTGPAGVLVFDHKTYTYSEVDHDGHTNLESKGQDILASSDKKGRSLDSNAYELA